jgi:hypothetical protein
MMTKQAILDKIRRWNQTHPAEDQQRPQAHTEPSQRPRPSIDAMTTDTTANKGGRPRKSDDERKRHRVQVAMSDGELRDARRLAELQDTSVSAALAAAATTTLQTVLRNRTEASYTNLRVVRETDETRPCRVYVRSGSRNVIASVNDDPETVAFFQLIAAAPKMLEALKDCRDLIENMPVEELLMQVEAAIAKAEGREHE